MKTDNATLIRALNQLSLDIESPDGVANACIAEAAERIHDILIELVSANAALHTANEILKEIKCQYPITLDLVNQALRLTDREVK